MASLDTQLDAALAPPPRQHFTSIGCGHARSKTVFALAFLFRGLISALHELGFLSIGWPVASLIIIAKAADLAWISPSIYLISLPVLAQHYNIK